MASKFLDWTRFAEDQGWDAHQVRQQLPVKTWTKNKRDLLAERKMDILSGLVHARKFEWTEDILKTLDEYPKAIDMGLQIARGKLSQIADLFKDYQDNFRGKPEMMFRKVKGRKVRNKHPFETLNAGEIGALMSGIKSITEAKLKALMLDKWAISKLDLPLDIEEGEEGTGIGPRFTIEGKDNLTPEELQAWFDRYHDKPQLPPAEANIVGQSTKIVSSGNDTSFEGEKSELDEDGGS